MHKTILKYLLFALLAILFVAIVGIIYLSTQDINDFKSLLEDKFKEGTGLELKLDGDLNFEIEDALVVQTGKFSVSDQNGLLFSVDSMKFITDFSWPTDTFKIYELLISHPVYNFRTTGIQTFSEGNPTTSANASAKVVIDSFSVVGGRFLLMSAGDSTKITVDDVHISHGSLTFDPHKPVLEGLSISAHGNYESAHIFQLNTRKAQCNFSMEQGQLHFQNIFHSTQENSLNLRLDLNPEFVVYSIEGQLRNESISRLYELHGIELTDFVSGHFDADVNVKFSIPGDSLDLRSISGDLNVRSSDMILRGINLDKLIKSYRRTQSFCLKDVGSVLILGPWGLAISKGGDYANLAISASKDSSRIEYLSSHLSADSGIVQFQDVAFRSEKNRIVLGGKMDIVGQEYLGFYYALVDEEGCPEFREEFIGSFEKKQKNEVGKDLKVLMGPVTNLFKGTSSVIVDKDCKYRYTGIVDAPSKTNLFGKVKKKEQKEKKEKKSGLFRKKKND